MIDARGGAGTSRRKDNPDVFVRVEDCRTKHSKIELALFGPDGRGGMVKDINEIKMAVNNRLSGKDKAAILAAVIMAIASIIVALLK